MGELEKTESTEQDNGSNTPNKPWGMELNTFCMLLHLSQLAGFLVPLAGLILPIVMWATNKDDFPIVDKHGKNIFNWMLSALIYSVVCAILTIIVIGVFGFLALAICGIVFAVVGGIKANDGEVWPYPLTIRFFKLD